MNRKKKKFPLFLFELVALIVSLLLLYSCEDDSMAFNQDGKNLLQEDKKLIKETHYNQSIESPIVGFTSYEYDSRGNLILKNENDHFITQYVYDAENRLTRESILEGMLESSTRGVFVAYKEFDYPSAHEKVESTIGDNGEKLEQRYYYFNDLNYLIQEKYFAIAEAYRANNNALKLLFEKEYNYDGMGRLQNTIKKGYRYWMDEVSDTYLHEDHFNSYGDRVKYITRKGGDASSVSEAKWVFVYDDGLLMESYYDSETSKEFSYIRYVYDESGRKIKTYDYNDYLTGEWFYEGSYLVESHRYSPDGYDNIPDFKSITIYTYE